VRGYTEIARVTCAWRGSGVLGGDVLVGVADVEVLEWVKKVS
jgi:hypothetical protein